MAAGDPLAITNSRVVTLNTKQALTMVAADADTANLVQKFIYTPTGKDNKVVIGIQVGPTNGAVAHSIAAGVGPMGGPAKTGSTAQATTGIVQIETGRYRTATGTIEITFTPASGQRLTTDHLLKVWAIELQ